MRAVRRCFLCWICLQLFADGVSAARMDTNVALNKPAYASSLLYPATVLLPGKANDGNRDPEVTLSPNPSCTHSKKELNPWWAVDFGGPVSVGSILFTNRLGSAYRSANFIIGLTNVDPTTSAPTLWNYDVCGQWPGEVPAAATVELQCKRYMSPYRYLIVQFPIHDFMNFCELEVYPERFDWVKRLVGSRMVGKSTVSKTVSALVSCVNECATEPDCYSFNYRPADKTCELNSHVNPLVANSSDIVTDVAWDWWSATFVVVN